MVFTTTNIIMGVIIFAMFWHNANSLQKLHVSCPNTTLIRYPMFFQFEVDISGPMKVELKTNKELLESAK
jgi:hypothetical protein